MKSILTTLCLALAATSGLAQQLPNADFEGNWVDCIPWNNSNTSKQGTQPQDWKIANVMGVKFLGMTMGSTTVGEKAEGYNSGSAVKLTNTPNSIMNSQNVPGYLTLGTPWNTSVMGQNNDGGTFGGISFTSRPDALSFMYLRAHGKKSGKESTDKKYTWREDEPFTVVAYAWKGSTTQTGVPCDIAMSGNPSKTTMTNRDRNILGIDTYLGDADVKKSGDFALVCSINDSIAGDAAEWTEKTLDFKYEQKGLVPEMFNVVFASGSYFSNNLGCNNTLTVDNVKLIYRSQLSAIKFQDKEIEGFAADKYDYEITVPADYDLDDAGWDTEAGAVIGYAATKTENTLTAEDGQSATYTCKVTNADGADADGQNTHTYTVKFVKEAAPAPAATTLNGYLDIFCEELGGDLAKGQAAKVTITPAADGKVDFCLPNFALGDDDDAMQLGDIAVPGLTATTEGDRTSYEGEVKGLSLMGGMLHADVKVSGYVEGDTFDFQIPVDWMGTIISVRFYSESIKTGIGHVVVGKGAAAAGCYNAAGQRVSPNARGMVIIRKADGTTVKVFQ